jgi:branched-subunit amino acid aminotransferase/4-amino-4-deoxychorismate lyase
MESGSGKYICMNGDFVKADEPVLMINNRSFRYGDALVENIHAFGTEAQFLDIHLTRLKQSMQWLKMTVPAFLTTIAISGLITKLLNKNRIFGGASVQMMVFRDPDVTGPHSFHSPEGSKVSFALVSLSLASDHYDLNPHGYAIDIYSDMPKPAQRISFIKSTSALFYAMADLYREEKGLDECILVNEKGHLVESVRSNLFILRDDQLFSPSSEEGCIPGVMRKIIISCIPSTGKKIITDVPLVVSDLLAADEVFLTNAVEGIRWVGAFREKRYYRDMSHQLVKALNRMAFSAHDK